MSEQTSRRLSSCPFCHTVVLIAVMESPAHCPKCAHVLPSAANIRLRINICFISALLGMCLLIPAFSQPMVSIKQIGPAKTLSLLAGIRQLFRAEEYLLFWVVLVCSVVFPTLKLLGLLILSSEVPLWLWLKRWIFHFVELSGRWGFIDVYLTALSILIFESHNVHLASEPGLVWFVLMVALTIVATRFFTTRVYEEVTHVN